MVEATLFVPLMIVAVIQIVKMILPNVKGWLTIIVAIVLGVVVAMLDTHIGVTDITIAQGIVLALEAIGVTVLARKAGGNA